MMRTVSGLALPFKSVSVFLNSLLALFPHKHWLVDVEQKRNIYLYLMLIVSVVEVVLCN